MSLENKEVPDAKAGVSSPVLEDKTLTPFQEGSDASNLVCQVFHLRPITVQF